MIVEGIITVSQLYELVKYWGPLAGFSFMLYRGANWLKDKGKAAETIQTSVSTLDANVRAQTTQIVTELKELRSDIRTFYGPLAASATPVRSRRKRSAKPPSNDLRQDSDLILDV